MEGFASIADLDQQFGIPGMATVSAGNGGLPRVNISTPLAEGEIYLHGGHVTAWKPEGHKNVIYCSPRANWHDGLAIRGGVPICFPWFGDKADNPSAPAHGFVRTKAWNLRAVTQTADGVAVTMATDSDADTRKWWPFDFHLLCRAIFGAVLKLKLIVTNTGQEKFHFEEALHSYLAVGDAQQASLHGLDSTKFIDKVDNFTEKAQSGDVRFSAETDRIYLATTHEIELEDPEWRRRIIIRKENSNSTVIWNPWSEKSASMADLGAGQWQHFVCVETSNVGKSAVPLGPGETHIMTANLQLG